MVKRIFAGAGLILLPFIFEPGAPDESRLPKAKALAVLAILYGAYEIFKRVDRTLGCFVGYVALSAVFSRTGIPYEDLLLFLGAVGSLVFVYRAKEVDIFHGLRLFEIAACLSAIYSVAQVAGLDPFFHYHTWADIKPVAMFGQHTLFGPFLVSGFLAALFFRHYVAAFVMLLPIFIINSSFTFLSLGGGLLVWLLILHRRVALYALSIALAGVVLFVSFYPKEANEAMNDKGRFRLWKQSLILSERHWLLGHGFGTFKEIYPIFQLPELRRANGLDDSKMSEKTREFIREAEAIKAESGVFVSSHNDLVQVFFELGIIGVLLILAMVFKFYRLMLKQYWMPGYAAMCAIVTVFLLNSLGNFPFRLIPQAMIPLWIYVIVVSRNDILKTK
jgi:O-antigen ligase